MLKLIEMKDEFIELMIQKDLINLARDYIWLRNEKIAPIDNFVFEYLKPLTFLIKIDHTFIRKVQPVLVEMNDAKARVLKNIIKDDVNYGTLCKKLNFIYNLISNQKLRHKFFNFVYEDYKTYQTDLTKIELLSEDKKINVFFSTNLS